MAYNRKKDFEEPLQLVLAEIKTRQLAETKRFEQLIAYMTKLEELVDLELKDKKA